MANLRQGNKIHIPVMVDDVKNIEKMKFTRCTYFSIQCDTPSFNWFLETNIGTLPFLLLGLSGIIYCPLGEAYKFTLPNQIEELFDLADKQEGLYIDINDIWLPNMAFPNEIAKRGAAYRVYIEIFKNALKFREHQISFKTLEEICSEYPEGILLIGLAMKINYNTQKIMA